MASATAKLGEISANVSYPRAEFLRLTGIGAKTLARARREGLPIRRVGRNSFVLGSDWLEYLSTRAKTV